MGFAALMLIDLISRSRGMFRGNPARSAMRPIVRRLASTHPKTLARNGDSGRGIDNTQPWYHLYLTVDGTPDLEETVLSAARDAGYQLRVNEDRSTDHHTRLTGANGDRTMSANIHRDGVVRIDGRRIAHWNMSCTPPAGKAIVALILALPDRHQPGR